MLITTGAIIEWLDRCAIVTNRGLIASYHSHLINQLIKRVLQSATLCDPNQHLAPTQL